MRAITLENISKTYYDKSRQLTPVLAINNFDLHIAAGEAVVLLGPSGCGKTTLLRLIAGLEQPDSGRVLYNQTPLDAIPVGERGIGMVFQNYVLIPHWESRRTVGFFLRLRDREDEVPAHVETVAKITGVDIEKLMGRLPRHLSGGEKQRVSIARAFARDLELLLFDEPFANLDAKFRAQARVELKRLIQAFNVTLVYVTHDQVEAMSVADRIVIMKAGQIVQSGTYQALHDEPNSLFVAEFLGRPTINRFWGRVSQGCWDGSYMGRARLPCSHPEGSEVILGIRPMFVRLVAAGEGTPATVERSIPFYAEKYRLLEVWLRKRRWQIQVELADQHAPGDTIHCQLDWDKAQFFDAKTGARIA
ncbi:MAG: ABC transporter ATP-binding protein [Chloroflexi bacterium]|nr:ABC transporter ATP-binding protein [Chloroflexota bacterium]MCY4246412.1 ABC transporter ATP-binding protein [Chloroflexota bacterium]